MIIKIKFEKFKIEEKTNCYNKNSKESKKERHNYSNQTTLNTIPLSIFNFFDSFMTER